MVLVDSSIDEIRCVKLAFWKEDFGIDSVEVSDEKECVISKHSGEWEDEECLLAWVKAESLIPSWEDGPFEAQDAGSCFLKVRRDSFSLKEVLFEVVVKMDFMEIYFSFVSSFFR